MHPYLLWRKPPNLKGQCSNHDHVICSSTVATAPRYLSVSGFFLKIDKLLKIRF
jgi:hypothetical protein